MTRFISAVALSAAGLLLLSACAGDVVDAPAAEPVAGGTLVYATGDDEPACLDSANRGNVPQALLATQYLESLFYQDEEGEILPWLAESWEEAADQLSWTVTVRDEVSFTDGTPLNAESVKASIDHILNPDTQSTTGRLAASKITGVEVVDELTARIVLAEPDAALLESLSQVWLPIQSAAALARPIEENCESPVGTGPFIVDSWAKQDSVTLVRNEDYSTPPPGAEHEGPAYLDSIVWKFIPDASARFSALQAGEVDVIDTLQPENAVAIEDDPAYEVKIGSRPGNPVEIILNSQRAPFDDAKVREAFFASVDLDAALQSIYLGTVERSTSLLSSVTRYGVDNVDYEYDPELANELLDEAGWTEPDDEGFRTKDGTRLTVSFPIAPTVPLAQGVFEQIQATAKETGFDVHLRPLESAAWWTANYEWDYDAIALYYTKNSADVFRITFTSEANIPTTVGGYHGNNTGASIPELDEAIYGAAATSDDAERATLYETAQQILVDGFYVLPVYDQQTRLALRSDVEGVRFLPSLTLPTFYDAWLAR